MAAIKAVKADGQTLNDLLDWTATRFADRGALIYRSSVEILTLTYAKLKRHADRVATYLADQVVEKGDRVVIWPQARPVPPRR
jgi:acyl-CoA synthetase (AMP-forming)/AMP-acid ligase II